MMRLVIATALVAALSGCAQQYTADGTTYADARSFLADARAGQDSALATVTPLPRPLTRKNLVMGLPSEQAVYDEEFKTAQFFARGGPVNTDIIRTRARAKYLELSGFSRAVKQRGIYPQVTFVDMDAVSDSVVASTDADALYLTHPDQWFFATARDGRQIFAYDRSAQGLPAKFQSFIEAVQVQAVRE